ncbi:MAG: WD40 repeat domain-containing protein, partial [Planctomycetes bacterium]|nr:WD40 repeat domain-containing protein [Planctomycetota bacterium]
MKKEPHTEKRNKETGIQNETPEVYGVERGPDGIELRRRDFLALAAASAANAAIGAGARCAWGQEKKINELPQSGRVGVKTRKNVIPRLNLVPHSEVTSVAFSPDGALLAASSPTKLWNGNPTNCVQKLKESYVHNIETIAFNPSGQILVASGEHKIAIYDPRKGKRLGIVKTSWGGCYSLVFSPDGKRLASGELGKIRLLDPRSWKCVGVLTDQCRENIRSMSFSPNGKLLASRHRDRGEKDREILKIWDFQKEECLRTLDGFWGAALAFHPDGNMLAASIVHWKRGTGIVLINVRTGKEKRFLKGHRGPVNSICFSPDGKLLISGGTRGRIKFWNVETGKCLMTIHWKRSENLCLSLNPDGRTLAVGDKRGDIILMDIEDPSTVWYLFSRKRFLGQLVQARDLDS